MNTPALTPAPAGMPPLPAAPAPDGDARGWFARATDLIEGIVYWGIIGFGLGFPFLAAIYAYARS